MRSFFKKVDYCFSVTMRLSPCKLSVEQFDKEMAAILKQTFKENERAAEDCFPLYRSLRYFLHVFGQRYSIQYSLIFSFLNVCQTIDCASLEKFAMFQPLIYSLPLPCKDSDLTRNQGPRRALPFFLRSFLSSIKQRVAIIPKNWESYFKRKE